MSSGVLQDGNAIPAVFGIHGLHVMALEHTREGEDVTHIVVYN